MSTDEKKDWVKISAILVAVTATGTILICLFKGIIALNSVMELPGRMDKMERNQSITQHDVHIIAKAINVGLPDDTSIEDINYNSYPPKAGEKLVATKPESNN